MEEQAKEFQDYLVAIKKRKKGILLISLAVFFVSALVAFLLPPVYKSSSTILIEQQEIPQELVMSTVTSYAAERIQVIQARVMSRANLLKIIEKYDLYKDERKYETTDEILKRITEDISLDIISANVVDPRTGRPSSATIAFSLSFEGESPSTVQRVANELTSLYLNENLKNRTQKAEDTAEFFRQETQRLGGLIGELERKMAEFKEKNADRLPQLQPLNLQMLQRKESELDVIRTRLAALEDKKFYLEGQLAQIDPGNPSIASPGTRLKMAEAEYMSLKAKYSSEHPDVIKLKREIEALKAGGESDKERALAEELTRMRSDLVEAEKRYTAEHPDVMRLKNKIRELEVQLAELQQAPDKEYYMRQPDNPAYITLKAQLASIISEMKAVLEQRALLEKSIKDLELVIQTSPQVEREYNALNRDYENAVKLYQETKVKQSRADVAKQLEAEKKGERFSLIDPPALPEEPISPNRPAILFLGLILAVGSGIGYAFVADVISGSVRGSRAIHMMLGVAPLAVVPYQMNMSDVQKRKRIQKRVILLGVIILISAVLVIHFFISPLDVFWFRILRKIDILTA